MEMSVKNIAIMAVIAFAAVWAGNVLLRKIGAPDLQA